MGGHANDPTDALAVLGNEIRMTILRELADAEGALSYTELRERAGLRDSGKFNYHLTKLRRYFVRETEGGYELGPAGTRVIAAAGPPPADEESAAGAANGEAACPVCGEGDCGKLFHVHLTPPWK